MKISKFKLSLISVLGISLSGVIMAKGVGTSGGLTLIEPMGARPASLGEAYSAMTNDISAMGYNPASLPSLKTGAASFMYERGLAEDAFGQFIIGVPTSRGGLGLNVGYYNGGDIDIFDGTSERTVNSQTDLTVALSMARSVGPVSIGITGKYLSSELIETEKATAFAGDLGLSVPLSSRLQMGVAFQNYGTQLKFIEEGDDLPRIARAGLALNMGGSRFATTLLLDAPYFVNEEELRPGVGLEFGIGLLSLRAGYKQGSDQGEFSLGSGFLLGRSSLDYSFGMVEDLDAQHRVSLSMRFGDGATPPAFVKKSKEHRRDIYENDPEVALSNESEDRPTAVQIEENGPSTDYSQKSEPQRRYTLEHQAKKPMTPEKKKRIYTVKAGDTLGKIARRYYGSSSQWRIIYTANKHLLMDPGSLEKDQRIILP